MTWVPHSKWVERQHDGTQALDLDSVGADTINMAIVTESSINPDTIDLVTSLTAVGTATAWTGPVALVSPTCALSAGNLVFDANDPAVIASDASGFTDGRSLVLYETTNDFILAHHTEGASFGNVTGTLTITFDAAGIITWTI